MPDFCIGVVPCCLTVNFLDDSGESGSEGSSDGSEDNANQQVCISILANCSYVLVVTLLD